MTHALRYAVAGDLPAIMELEESTFAGDAWSAESMAAELVNPHCLYLVALADDTVVGYAGLLAPAGAGDADIQTVAVAPAHRRHGVGRALVTHLLIEARQRGATQVFLEVRADNPGAEALYRMLGFDSIGVRAGYYQPDNVDAVVMRARIDEPSPEWTDAVSLSQPDASVDDARRMTDPVVLGIETSCDETGVGIVRGRTLLANVIASSMAEHSRFGGVVPEIAARAHVEAIGPALEAALAEAELQWADIDAIAVTAGPGLSGALMVGVGAAKALSLALDVPLYAVNHLVGHVGADTLTEEAIDYPTIALLVSGGHTSLLHVRNLIDDVEMLGETIDDAAGEAFDKVARLLGLPYPGGPQIDRVAATGNPAAIRFPRGLSLPKDQVAHRYDFSFSGLKTAVARWVEQKQDAGEEVPVADVAASFREAVVDVLLTKAIAACHDRGVPRLLLGGGVVANARVRQVAEERCQAEGIELRIPPLALCTDNGAMIAALGAHLVMAGHAPSTLDFAADSTLPVTEVQSGRRD